MKVQVLGNNCALTSTITKADYDIVARYQPSALVVTNEENEEVFRLGYSSSASITSFGVTFNGTTRAEVPTLLAIVPIESDDPKTAIADLLVPIKHYIDALEESIPQVAQTYRDSQTAIADTIEVVL